MKTRFTIHDSRLRASENEACHFTGRSRRSTASPSPGGDLSRLGNGERNLSRYSGTKVAQQPSEWARASQRRGEGGLTSKANSRKSQIVNHKSQQGVALVITLILLAVTLVMAIAFLAISRRERNSVTTVTMQFTARDAVDAALANCEVQIASTLQATTNPYVFSLLVSTNFINAYGFTNGVANPHNVNYSFQDAGDGGGPLTAAMLQRNIANLFYKPRPPVFYSNDFRFYLDLNRNGRFDTNGVVTNIDNNFVGLGSCSLQVGDPEWIGILEHPDAPHSANNPFIGRYCFIAVPANSLDLNRIHNQVFDTALAAGNPVNSGLVSDAYSRDQGVGTWEINLAAFLADLNTNRWDPPTIWNSLGEPYTYPEGLSGRSAAFDNARALIAWRIANQYYFLNTADAMFGGAFGLGDYAFRNNGVDNYGISQQATFDANFSGYANPALPWAGAEVTNNFFSLPSDLFDTNRANFATGGNYQNGYSQFVTNLYSAGTNNSTYDRYTFYRMLAQLGTDTAAEANKLDLNYSNALVIYATNTLEGFTTLTPVSITIMPDAQTNFNHWTPQDFFTAAADKMLHTYTAEWYAASPSNYLQTYYGITDPYYLSLAGVGVTNVGQYQAGISGDFLVGFQGQASTTNQVPGFGITNIPVYINNQFVYTPAVNRVLQLAANIYDASTNTMSPGMSNYPSVFRPIFWTTNEYSYVLNEFVTNIYIKGYEYVPEPITTQTRPIFNVPDELTTLPYGLCDSNVWGVPWILGAKKGLPNFNAFEMDNTFFVERELQFNRNSFAPSTATTFPYGRIYTTNQMYIMGVSNTFGVEDWNSYGEPYNNPVKIVAQDLLSVGMSNNANNASYSVVNTLFTNSVNTMPLAVQPWYENQFIMPLGTNMFTPQNLASLNSSTIPPSTNNLYSFYNGPGNTITIGAFSFTPPCFIPLSLNPTNFADRGTPPLPQFGLSVTNHLQAYMVDTPPGQSGTYILDYVQLGDMSSSLNINQAIADPNSTEAQNGQTGGLWATNTFTGGGQTSYGVYEQYLVSSIGGGVPPPDGDGGLWTMAAVPGAGNDNSPAAQQAFFSAFFTASGSAAYGETILTNTQFSIQAPYTPMREIVQRYNFQANDPLVHYLTSDLNDLVDDASNIVQLSATNQSNTKYLGQISDRYMPWGTVGNITKLTYNGATPDGNAYNLSYKDPAVYTPDNWDFPTNKYPTIGWLGRVHRGTPWQTVYLKSTNLLSLNTVIPTGPTVNQGVPTWQVWTGNQNTNDAQNAAPIQDRLLFDLFTTALDDDSTRGQVSVNIGADDPTNMLAGLASWSALFSGTLVLSNSLPDAVVSFQKYWGYQSPLSITVPAQKLPQYVIWTNQPIGSPPYPGTPPSITNSAMWQLVTGINSARTNFVGIDGLQGAFEHVGDILSVPQLSDDSPFLHVQNSGSADTPQLQRGISDEMYEWLPQQAMSLLTISGAPQSPPRYVVYCYGQTLKPAPNGIVSSGPFFGLVTNYQVQAESAMRAVIRVENAPTPANPNSVPHIVVEQFNPLPPD
jgi:hypothetical protein